MEPKDYVLGVGVLVTFILGIWNVVANWRSSRRTAFINTVTAERVKWLGTLRENISASHNNCGAMLLDVRSGMDYQSPLQCGHYQAYEIRSIVDRVGSGDAFDAGLLYGLTHPEFSVQSALEFATAASCLSHSVVGDCNFASRQEIEDLMNGATSGRVVR